MTINNICSGFRATGIYPFNKNAIPVEAFAPSLPSHVRPSDVQPQVTPPEEDNLLEEANALERATTSRRSSRQEDSM